MWETIPGVIRNNGTDTFRLEVNVNGPVSNVVISLRESIVGQTGLTTFLLRDDGLAGDRQAADFIFTSEPLRFNTNKQSLLPAYFNNDINSPWGLAIQTVCSVTINETNGTTGRFLNPPGIGILNTNVPLIEAYSVSTNLALTDHVINLRGTNLATQKLLRGYLSAPDELPRKVYGVMPDTYDVFVCFSTYHVERTPYGTTANFVAGVQVPVQVNYSGTGQAMFNNSASYGSGGRLLGVCALDSYDRGVFSANCTHEILHHWASFMGSLPFSNGQHYMARSSVGSLLGGYKWDSNGLGGWKVNCNEGEAGATQLDPLDKYLMGLISAEDVPTLYTYSTSDPSPGLLCNKTVSNIVSQTTIAQIVATYGQRTPGPATAKRDFSIGFIAESYQRLLTPAELTFYEILAAHYTRPLGGFQRPFVGYNWAPITQFFGEGTTWKSEVLPIFRPVIATIERLPTGAAQVTGHGYPGANYRLVRSTNNFGSWHFVTNKAAGTNGVFVLVDSSTATASPRFYRVATP